MALHKSLLHKIIQAPVLPLARTLSLSNNSSLKRKVVIFFAAIVAFIIVILLYLLWKHSPHYNS